MRVVSYKVCWLANNAITEACRIKKSYFFREILGNYKNIVNQLNLTELATRFQIGPVRSSHELVFKHLMLTFLYCHEGYKVSHDKITQLNYPKHDHYMKPF